MCGTLGHNSLKFTIGNIILVEGESGPIKGIWLSHSRSESLEKWIKGGWKEGTLSVTSYTEGHHPAVEFQVPKGKAIKVIYNPNIVFKGAFPTNIVTTIPGSSEQAKVHPRFPVLIKK